MANIMSPPLTPPVNGRGTVRVCCAFALLLLFFTSSALAAAPHKDTQKSLGSFGNWRTYTFTEGSTQACYMSLTAPVAKIKNIKQRGAARLTITHRPAESSKDVVSYAPGYTYKAATSAEAHIGKAHFSLFTSADAAWTRDASADRMMATAIRNGATMTVTGTPAAKGTSPVTDHIDLKGAAQAYRAIGKACGYPDDTPKAPQKKKAKTPQKA